MAGRTRAFERWLALLPLVRRPLRQAHCQRPCLEVQPGVLRVLSGQAHDARSSVLEIRDDRIEPGHTLFDVIRYEDISLL